MVSDEQGVYVQLSAMRIINHARLTDSTIAVRGNLILIGPNDAGKSSILRCLDLVLGSTTAQLYSRIGPQDFRDQSRPLTIEVDLTTFTPAEEGIFPDEITVEPDGAMYLRIRLEAEIDVAGTLQIRRFAPTGGTGRQISRDQLLSFRWKIATATEAATRDFRRDRNDSVHDILTTIDLGAEAEGFAGVAQEFQRRLRDSQVLGDLRGKIANQLSRALPEKFERDDLSFITQSLDNDDILGEVRLHVRRAGEMRSPEQLSDGTRALFAVALYELVGEAANIIAVDEPEIHLHPTSQRSMARLLRMGTNQKVIATHSSDIVGCFPPEQIVCVRPGGEIVQPAHNFLSRDQKLLAHWWVRDRLEPLTARRVILVEGVADRIILERVSEVIDLQLDRLGISVVELDGAGGVGQALTIFGKQGFHVPLSFLIDSDAAPPTAAKLGVNQAQLNESSVFICKPDLEAEYVRALGAPTLWTSLEQSGGFSRNELQNCPMTGSVGGARTDEDVSAFCRKNKVRAAMLACTIIDQASANKIHPVVNLLQAAAR